MTDIQGLSPRSPVSPKSWFSVGSKKSSASDGPISSDPPVLKPPFDPRQVVQMTTHKFPDKGELSLSPGPGSPSSNSSAEGLSPTSTEGQTPTLERGNQLLTPEQNEVIDELVKKGIPLNDFEEVNMALRDGIAGKTREDVITLLTSPAIKRLEPDLYLIATRMSLSDKQKELIKELSKIGVGKYLDINEALKNGICGISKDEVLDLLTQPKVQLAEPLLYSTMMIIKSAKQRLEVKGNNPSRGIKVPEKKPFTLP